MPAKHFKRYLAIYKQKLFSKMACFKFFRKLSYSKITYYTVDLLIDTCVHNVNLIFIIVD